MAEAPNIPILEYLPPVPKYRPRAWQAILTIVLPSVIHSLATAAMYCSQPEGLPNHGGFSLASLALGIIVGSVVIARSGFGVPLKSVLILIYGPAQFFALQSRALILGDHGEQAFRIAVSGAMASEKDNEFNACGLSIQALVRLGSIDEAIGIAADGPV